MRGEQMKKVILVLMAVISASLVLAGNGLLASDEVFHGGDIVYTEPVKAVLFSHTSHVETLGLPCDMCHTEIFGMAGLSAQANDDFTMEGLYEGKYCGACHNGTMAFASDTQCARCHIGVKGYERLQNPGGSEPTGH
jgi:c(7)-type cytochrome triheme protein